MILSKNIHKQRKTVPEFGHCLLYYSYPSQLIKLNSKPIKKERKMCMLYLNEKKKDGYVLAYQEENPVDSFEDWGEFMLRFPQTAMAHTKISIEEIPEDVLERVRWCKYLEAEKNNQETVLQDNILTILKENGEIQEALEELPPYITRAKFSHTDFEFDVNIDGKTKTFTIEDSVMGWYLEEDEHAIEYARAANGLFNIYEDQSPTGEDVQEDDDDF